MSHRASHILWPALALLVACAPRTTIQPGFSRPLGSEDVDAVAVLLELEDRRYFQRDVLARLAAASHPEVRRRTALTIGRLGGQGGTDLLAGLLADADTAVAATAAFALGLVGDTSAVGALAERFASPASPPTVRAEAAAALGRLGTRSARLALEALLRAPSPPDHVAGEALLAITRSPRSDDLAPVVRWTTAADPELRWRATYALSRRADPRATPVLLGLLGDADSRVRGLAVRGLTATLADSAGVGAARAAASVRALAGNADRSVRVSAVRTLGTHSDSATVALLRDLLRDADPWIAATAAESLGRLGPQAIAAGQALADATSHSRPLPLRLAAVHALQKVAPDRATERSRELLHDPVWRVRAAAAPAVLIEALQDRDSRVAAAALRGAVQAAGDSVAGLRRTLIHALGTRDVVVRTEALNGIAKLRDPALVPVILDAYARSANDTLNDARLAAIDALAAVRAVSTKPERAFFARFERSADPVVVARAVREFGSAAIAAWGEPRPIDVQRPPGYYRSLVERWVRPALEGASAPRAWIDTDSGRVSLELFAADAPLTTENFVGLADAGYFRGQEWPRVVPGFVIQGGDPRGDTSGGPGYAIRDEINRHRYQRGALGMALSGPDTGGSQWFVTHSPQPHLDGGYTAFGRVLSGQEVVDRVQIGDRIHGVTIEPR